MGGLPLPPGDYVIEIEDTKYPFSLAEGERHLFQREQKQKGRPAAARSVTRSMLNTRGHAIRLNVLLRQLFM
jgi:hypothetical protein